MKYIGLICFIAYFALVVIAWCNDTSIADFIVDWMYRG